MADEQLELTTTVRDSKDDQADLESRQNAVLRAVAGAKLDTLQEKVAWILNHFPDTRDSDVTLYIRFWTEFEAEHLHNDVIPLQELYRLTRPMSLTRARAKLQNEFRLFLANDEVRRRRGTLSDEEREKARAQQPRFPKYTVYTDESGKTDDHLVVGSVWFLNGPEILQLSREVESLANNRNVSAELHFKEITEGVVEFYLEVVDLILQRAAVISFSSLSVERRGHKNIDLVLAQLHFHLIVKGIEHHDASGRAPLPRSITVFKDQEEAGRDKLLLADLGERLRQASQTRFDGKLQVDHLAPVSSAEDIPVQVADLYTSSVARVLNAKGMRSTPRDRVADALLEGLGTPEGPTSADRVGDIAVHMAL